MKIRVSLVEKRVKGTPLTPAERRQRVEAARSPRREHKYATGSTVHHERFGFGKVVGTSYNDKGKPVYSIQYENPVQVMLGADPFVPEHELKPLTHGQRLGRDIRAYHEKERKRLGYK